MVQSVYGKDKLLNYFPANLGMNQNNIKLLDKVGRLCKNSSKEAGRGDERELMERTEASSFSFGGYYVINFHLKHIEFMFQ